MSSRTIAALAVIVGVLYTVIWLATFVFSLADIGFHWRLLEFALHCGVGLMLLSCGVALGDLIGERDAAVKRRRAAELNEMRERSPTLIANSDRQWPAEEPAVYGDCKRPPLPDARTRRNLTLCGDYPKFLRRGGGDPPTDL